MREELNKAATIISNLYALNVLKPEEVKTTFCYKKELATRKRKSMLVFRREKQEVEQKETTWIVITITAKKDVTNICSDLFCELLHKENMTVIQYISDKKEHTVIRISICCG